MKDASCRSHSIIFLGGALGRDWPFEEAIGLDGEREDEDGGLKKSGDLGIGGWPSWVCEFRRELHSGAAVMLVLIHYHHSGSYHNFFL